MTNIWGALIGNDYNTCFNLSRVHNNKHVLLITFIHVIVISTPINNLVLNSSLFDRFIYILTAIQWSPSNEINVTKNYSSEMTHRIAVAISLLVSPPPKTITKYTEVISTTYEITEEGGSLSWTSGYNPVELVSSLLWLQNWENRLLRLSLRTPTLSRKRRNRTYWKSGRLSSIWEAKVTFNVSWITRAP